MKVLNSLRGYAGWSGPANAQSHVFAWCGLYELRRQIAYIRTCAPGKDSDQPANLRCLIRIFTRRIWDSQESNVPIWDDRKLTRLHGCAGWVESSLGAHVRRYVFHFAALTCKKGLYCICAQRGPDQRAHSHSLISCPLKDTAFGSTAHVSAHNGLPSRHMTFIQRRLHVDATSRRCIDVEATL